MTKSFTKLVLIFLTTATIPFFTVADSLNLNRIIGVKTEHKVLEYVRIQVIPSSETNSQGFISLDCAPECNPSRYNYTENTKVRNISGKSIPIDSLYLHSGKHADVFVRLDNSLVDDVVVSF